MNPLRHVLVLLFAGIGIIHCQSACADESPAQSAHKLKLAIEDLIDTYDSAYPEGPHYLKRLDVLLPALNPDNHQAREALEALRCEALLANPALRKLPGILVVQRKPNDPRSPGVMTALDKKIGFSAGLARDIAMPSNHECNASLERTGYDDRIAMLDPRAPETTLKTVYRPDHGGYVGQLDLDFDARHLLFTQSDETNWKLFEWDLGCARLRQVSHLPDDVDCMDGAYLPNGNIVFGSTASYQAVPCWHGQKRVSNLYLMKRDGSGVRQVCFDQDHDFHPTILNNGQVLYLRWDYTGICHIFLRELMVMNPDGTQQRAVYGSNSWYLNSLFFSCALPGEPNRIISILSGYHGTHRAGQLVLLDTSQGWYGASGIVQRISGRGDPIAPKIKDDLVQGDWPLFLHPHALTNKHFLVSAKLNARSDWAIYLADTFDNLVLIRAEPGYALLEPTPMVVRKRPPVIPEQVDLTQDEATVFIQDVYAGAGLQGVPRGTAKKLRLIAYNFGFRGLAGPDKIGYGGPWEAMQILGTVPLEPDGSARFEIPANTPVAVQVLDHEDKAIQLMRSWFTAMPGEHVACAGCHEAPNEAVESKPVLAANRQARALTPWYGPARGFDFEREIQPVLDAYCVSCHNGSSAGVADLRSESDGARAEPKPIGYVPRLHPDMFEATRGKLIYSAAYDVLIHTIRRVGIEDDVSLLCPGEYHADTSELIQMLEKGHHGVVLDAEAWSRLVTWIDLNGPCHGTWGDVFPVPDGAHERRMALQKRYGGPMHDPETIVETSTSLAAAVSPGVRSRPVLHPGQARPLALAKTRQARQHLMPVTRRIDIDGVTLSLVRVPAGSFIMGDVNGCADELPQRLVRLDAPFWMSEYEVTNAQFRRFDDHHLVTAPVGSYRPNPWGLYDMHGNAAEWTRSDYDPNRKVIRGGSFFDRPARSRSSVRWGYPTWQRVFNVGFRIIVLDEDIPPRLAKGDRH